MTTTTVYLAWQAPQSRRWYPVGRLRRTGAQFEYVYTAGALDARDEDGFHPLVSFPDLHGRYESDSIFPLFANRLLSPGRREYDDFVEWLNLSQTEPDPLVLLARSGGHRLTDSLEVFPCPERGPDGVYRVHFFVHGVRHQSAAAQERMASLAPGERLRLQRDEQNERDPSAINLRTDEQHPGDMHLLGYLPRYLAEDFAGIRFSSNAPVVEVERVNPDAPVHFSLLCRMAMPWPDEFKPFSGPLYRPLASPA